MTRAAIAVIAITVATCWSTSAYANGRFPAASQLAADPSDGRHIVLRTTYGVVQTFDAGATWRWLCETSVGYSGNFDPAIALTGSHLLVGLTDGLAISADRGCDFTRTLDGSRVVDLVTEPRDPSHALALTMEAASIRVVASLDSGATWSPIGVALPSDLKVETIEVAPSRPQRVYVSGVASARGVIEKSDDSGATWERLSVELGTGGLAPYVAAVDPNDADVVYVRVDGDATFAAPDRLLVTRDGGRTFVEIGRTTGDMLGFALSPDGARVAFGGPTDGVFVTSTTSSASAPISPIGARCLLWSAAGLYACGRQDVDGFTVGRSNDDGRTWKSLYALSEVSPLVCGTSTSTGRLCPREWPAVQLTIGVPDDDAGADAGTLAPPGDDGGCACATASPPPTRMSWVVVASIALVWGARRRRF